MKKSFLIIFLIILLSTSAFFNLAMAQTTAETNSSSSVIQIKSASAFIHTAENFLKEAWQKVAGSKRGEALSKTKAWFTTRKQAIKNGWQEEKQEFSGNIKEIITKAWQKAIDKVKSWVIPKRGD